MLRETDLLRVKLVAHTFLDAGDRSLPGDRQPPLHELRDLRASE